MVRPRRIVCYAINGAGMGHITRLLGVAKWLRRLVALLDECAPEILFLSSSDASDMLADARFATFKIPSKTVARTSGLDKLEYRRLAKQFVWQTLGVFTPDLLIVDTFPAGSFDELFQILDGPFKKSFIGRCVKPEYAARATFRSAVSLYDVVVVPHQSNSWEAKLCATQLHDIPVHYSGEVIQFDREELPSRLVARAELGVGDDQRLIYVSAGGGGDPESAATIQRLVNVLIENPSIHVLVGAGPLYRGVRRAGPQITWSNSPSVWRYFPGCDGAISAGGYNTFHELLSAGVPSLFFAQDKIADDQWQRIHAAAMQGACLLLENVQDMQEIRSKVSELGEADVSSRLHQRGPSLVIEHGALQCACDLLRPIYPADRLDWGMTLLSPSLVHALESFSDGSPTILSDWLAPLFPQGRMERMMSLPALEAILSRLTPSAAQELQQVLHQSDGPQERRLIERRLLDLLLLVKNIGDPSHTRGLADETLRALQSAIRKYGVFAGEQEIEWTSWVDSVLQGIVGLLDRQWSISHGEVLRLFRMFPRIDDAADVHESFMVFRDYLDERLTLGLPTHEIMHQLQVLKMAHPSISRNRLSNSREAMP